MSENKSTVNSDTLDDVLNDTGNNTDSAFGLSAKDKADPKMNPPRKVHISEIGEDTDDVQRDEMGMKSQEEIEAENWLRMNRDKKNLAVKRGYVTGIRPDEENNTVYFITKIYGFSVFIPDTEYFMPSYRFSTDYPNKSEKEQYLERLNRAQYEKGARIMFVLTDVDRAPIPPEVLEDYEWESKWTYKLKGSRKRAMEIAVYAKFFNPNRDVVNNPMPKVGNRVKAFILSVRPEGCRVEALGVESFVSNFELTGTRWVDNAQSEPDIKPGKWFYALIKKLYIHENDHTVYMSVSGRQYDTGKTSKNILETREGDFAIGTVRNYNPNSKTYTVILDNGVLCSVPEGNVGNGVILEPGNTVSVKVLDVLKEFVVGFAIKV